MSVLLGIDGGGTKTEFVLINVSGQVLASWREGPAYYLETGIERLRAMLVSGVQQVSKVARLAPRDIAYAFVGLPAYGEDSRLQPQLNEAVAVALPQTPHCCGNDMLCGWAGALGGGDGINIVAGTGSIAYGEFESRSARAGGWGELFSDEGSAYWIAREALRHFSRMSDGREPRGALYELIRARFDLDGDLDVCAALYGPPAMSRSAIAGLAPLVTQAAAAGDTTAGHLFERAAQELAAMVHAVRDQLAVPPTHPMPVTYSGGLFRAQNSLLTRLPKALEANERCYEWVTPRLPPGAGAALYAARQGGIRLTPAAIAQLAADCATGNGGISGDLS